MLGWRELTQLVVEAWEQDKDENSVLIYAKNYGQVGAIDHSGKKYGLPPVQSFSDAYRHWLPDLIMPKTKFLIYINDELGEDMPGFFEEIEKVGELDLPLARENGTQVYLCHRPTSSFYARMNKAIYNARNQIPIE